MKFLFVNSGIPGEASMPASRSALIYDESGRIIWKSSDVTTPLSNKEITLLFKRLHTALGEIH